MALVFGYLGALMGMLMVLPQLGRTLRYRQVDGVSPLASGLMAAGCFTWLFYGMRTSSPTQIVGSIVPICGAATIALLVPGVLAPVRRALLLVGAAAMLGIAALTLPSVMVGFLAMVVSLASAVPQVVKSCANRKSSDASGVSLSSWALRIGATMCCIAYALLAADVPVLVASCLGLVTGGTVLAMTWASRQPSRSEVFAKEPAYAGRVGGA